MKKVAVVGAGFGGMACAARLARDGYDVRVYDQQSGPGGKAGSKLIKGYRFDTGPSLLTMKEEFESLFSYCGEDLYQYVDIIELAPICNYFFDDGLRLSSFRDRARFKQEIAAHTSEDPAHLDDYLDYTSRIYEHSHQTFLRNSLGWASLKSLFDLPYIDPLRTMHQANHSFFRDKHLVQLFDRYATYNGSDPYKVPATLNIIQHVEYNMGSYAVRQGIYALSQALYRLAQKMGARFHFDTKIQSIDQRSGRIRGLTLDGTHLPYDIVISNVDVFTTYHSLLNDPYSRFARLYQRLEPSSSGLVFYWGIKKSFPELDVNNIFFSKDYRKDFQDIFMHHRCPLDPTVYVNITSKVNPDDAPAGCENWFVLVNAPSHEGQDWAEETKQVRHAVLHRLEQSLGVNIEDLIDAEETLNPAQIEELTGSYHGGLYGISSNTMTAAFRRHPNRSRQYQGLYFCGGSAHPGGGMPLVLLSAQITHREIIHHEGTKHG